MRRPTPFLLLFLIPLLACAQEGIDRESVRNVKKATVFIELVHDHPLEEGTVEGSGSGFFIDEHGRIATNHHVISPWVSAMGLPYPAPVQSITGYVHSGSDSVRKVPLRVLYQNSERDLAILAPKEPIEVPQKLDVKSGPDLYETMSVWAFGYPHGKKHSVLQTGPDVTVTMGNISALRHGDRDTLRTIQMDASVAPGNSGGPLVDSEGNALGVVYRRGEGEMNEAVPGHFLQRMIDRLPEGRLASPFSLSLESDPEGARVFIDDQDRGVTPFHSDSMEGGIHTIDLYKEGHRTLHRTITLRRDTSIRMEAEPIDEHPLERNETTAEAQELPALRTKGPLLEEDFDDPERFRTWEQNTGGVSERTWFLEEGRLRQHQRNGTLHAITLQEVEQSPYRIQASVKMPGRGDGDDRAGLIFGDTPRGFYLFRIYRESNKAELAYHSRSPFGWTILQQHALDRELDMEEWYELSVSVLGERVVCELDGERLIDLQVPSLSQGKVGFYSVESRPAFDSLRIDHLELEGKLEELEGKPGTESFWFTDRFDRSSGWWWPSVGADDSLAAPFVSDVGTSVRADSPDQHRMRFRRYELSDMQLRAIISTDEGGENASFEWSFLETEDSRVALRFEADSLLNVYHIQDDDEKLLDTDTLNSSIFGGPTLLQFELEGRDFELHTRFGADVEGELPEGIELAPGSISFALRDLRGVFHRMTVSSLDRGTQEEEGGE